MYNIFLYKGHFLVNLSPTILMSGIFIFFGSSLKMRPELYFLFGNHPSLTKKCNDESALALDRGEVFQKKWNSLLYRLCGQNKCDRFTLNTCRAVAKLHFHLVSAVTMVSLCTTAQYVIQFFTVQFQVFVCFFISCKICSNY